MTRQDQTIILTGSTTPLAGFGMSDAGFNLGYALSCAQTSPQGIYICLKGKAQKLE